MITETDISRNDLWQPQRLEGLSETDRRLLGAVLSNGTDSIDRLATRDIPTTINQRNRASVYADSVGIGHYAIDFHPCMQNSPAELPNNQERQGGRSGEGQAYPFQIPLRSMIPQKIDNLLVAGKSIAVSHIAAAAYRVHSFEWSVGAAAAGTVVYAMEKGVIPYQLVENLPKKAAQLQELRKRLELQNNPTLFPGTSTIRSNWKDWQ
jgi:hypothetical protein